MMKDVDIVRAWKDETYRDSLSPEQRMMLPEHPAGMIELIEEDLNAVNGGSILPPSVIVCVNTSYLNCSTLGIATCRVTATIAP